MESSLLEEQPITITNKNNVHGNKQIAKDRLKNDSLGSTVGFTIIFPPSELPEQVLTVALIELRPLSQETQLP